MFSCIAAFFASVTSVFGPSESKSAGVEKTTVHGCFKTMVSVIPQASEAQEVMSAAADLRSVVALSDDRAYWPGYAPSASSNVITLKWNTTVPRFVPMGVDELAGERRYAENFRKDFPRACYWVSDDSNPEKCLDAKAHVEEIKGESVEEAFNKMSAHVNSADDLSRITEVAHQGHLAPVAGELLHMQPECGEYMFVQKGHSTRHEIIANGASVVAVRSSVEFEAKHMGTGRTLTGLTVFAVINTRIGYTGGKLDHKALGGELSNMAFEIRYEKPKSMAVGLDTLRRQEPDKLLMPV